MRQRGFTLVELLIVVAIISVLAVVAGTAYRRYMDSTRTAEVYAMLGEFRNKQEAYRSEYSTYVTTGVNEADFYPALLGVGKEPAAKTVTRPASWVALGINPNKRQLYCGYVAIKGDAGGKPTGVRGLAFLGDVDQTTPWWYMVASCDNDGDGNAGHNAYFVTSSTNTTVYTENEHW